MARPLPYIGPVNARYAPAAAGAGESAGPSRPAGPLSQNKETYPIKIFLRTLVRCFPNDSAGFGPAHSKKIVK